MPASRRGWRWRAVAVLLSLPLGATAVRPSTWYVLDDGSGDAPTIQAGVDSAAVGDTVLVAAGTYLGNGNRDIDLRGKAVVVRSEAGAEHTTIEPGGALYDSHRGFLFTNGETPATVVEGFTVRDAYVSSTASLVAGAALLCIGSSPSIRDCVLRDSKAGGGAGIYCGFGSSALVFECDFLDNSTVGGGGAVSIAFDSSPTFTDCMLEGNSTGGQGGAVYVSQTSLPVFVNCTFSSNGADGVGGAVFARAGASVAFTDCRFVRNHTDFMGGVVGTDDGASAEFVCCLFLENLASQGASVLAAGRRGERLFTSCTFTGNAAPTAVIAYASSVPSGPTDFMNCLLAFNGPGANLIYCTGGGDPVFTCSNIYGNECGDWEGCIAGQAGINGNFSADPLFCDWENGDFTLAENSPCLPAGNTCRVQIGAFGQGCEGTRLAPMSWGSLKGKYRWGAGPPTAARFTPDVAAR